MRIFKGKISPFIISIIAVLAVTVAVCLLTLSCPGNKLTFKCAFYYICYRSEDNAVSASSVSSVVSSYGGAGYILEYGDAFYVTVACYYDNNDANAVCESLKRRDLNCEVVKIETDDYSVTNSSQENNSLYLGNLNTLHNLSSLAYGCANALDTGEYSQSQAKSIISDVENGLKGLLNVNANNCFTPHLKRLIATCDEVGEGYVYSKDLRRLQIAITDVIINVKLY